MRTTMNMDTVALLSPLISKLRFKQKVIDGKTKLVVSTWSTRLFTYELISRNKANIDGLSEKRAQKILKIIRSIGSPDLTNLINEANQPVLVAKMNEFLIPKLVYAYFIKEQIARTAPTLREEASTKFMYITVSDNGCLQIREIRPKKEFGLTIVEACKCSAENQEIVAEMYQRFRNTVGHNDVVVTDKTTLEVAWRAYSKYFENESNLAGA